jgi:hypothetical protein
LEVPLLAPGEGSSRRSVKEGDPIAEGDVGIILG